MVGISHWSSEGYRLYTYVTFALLSKVAIDHLIKVAISMPI